jgi:hypothetical protein
MEDCKKTNPPQWFVNIFVVLVIAAYGFIFNSLLERLTKAEIKLDGISVPLLQIQTDLSSIKTDLGWLKNNK